MKLKNLLSAGLLIMLAPLYLFAELGDVDGDGMVTMIDALKIEDYVQGLYVNPFDESAADVNCDEVIDGTDSLLVAQYFTGLITTFPCHVDPSLPGSTAYSVIYYASSGTQKINRYQNPSPDYTVNRRMDFTVLYSSVDSTYWGFGADSVPINGIAAVPSGDGPFPLAVFMHGNHNYYEYSDAGYLYLCEILASHGIIAATIDLNFINHSVNDRLDARTVGILEHVKQFKIWNEQPGHPLYNKVDLDNVMLTGHSEGGEAASLASVYNTCTSMLDDSSPYETVSLDGTDQFGPYNFGISGVISIAPSYYFKHFKASVPTNFLLIQGNDDDEQDSFTGAKFYDLAHPANLNDSDADADAFKSLFWIYNANHSYFNSDWDPRLPCQIIGCELPRATQMEITAISVASFARAVLLDSKNYMRVIKDYQVALEWLPANTVTDIGGTPVPTKSYISQYGGGERYFINHFDEDRVESTASSNTSGYNITNNSTGAAEMFLEDMTGEPYLNMETYGLRFSWDTTGKFYETYFPSQTLDATGYKYFALRAGQSAEANNTCGQDQDFTIIITDSSNNSYSVAVSSVSRLPYKGDPDPTGFVEKNTVLQTVLVPLQAASDAGVDITDIVSIKFDFNLTASGTLYLDDIQLMN